MREIYLVRHGQTEWNATGRFQGRRPVGLSELGRRQADINGRLLAELGADALFASPLERTRQTAEIVRRHVPIPVTYDERIVEWSCGDWTGYLFEEVAEQWPAEWAALAADPFHYRGPGCENYPDMFLRAGPFLEDVLRSEADRVAIVSHGTIGKVMASILLGLDEEATLRVDQPNGVMFRIVQGVAGTQADHYRDGDGPFPGLFTRGA